jgi:hypothetical protein
MSGLGIQYPPPTEDVPIFDPLLFLEAVVIAEGGGGGGSYLNFPFAQGKETMAEMDVTGVANFFSGITMTGALGEDFKNNQNIIMNGTSGTNYVQFPDSSKQYTAYTLPSPLPASGNYTNSNITLNASGQITAISNGSGGGGSSLISTQIFTTNSNITLPVGTAFVTIMVSGAGGASGGFYFDNPNNVTTAGGAGGAGGCAIIPRLPMEAGTNLVCAFTNNNGSCTVGYLPVANSVYLTNIPLASANAGAGGVTAVSTGGNPAGGVGGTMSIGFSPMGYGLQGATGGSGQQSSTTFAIRSGINLLSTLNQNMVISTTTTPFNYGAGGYTRINDGANGNATINNPGSAVCIVLSYSS